jgi:hypothetical protein
VRRPRSGRRGSRVAGQVSERRWWLAVAGRGKFAILIAVAAALMNTRILPGWHSITRRGSHVSTCERRRPIGGTISGRGFALHRDGQADFLEQQYTYFLYLMGASSGSNYPPRFGGMLWYTNGDMRAWPAALRANTNASTATSCRRPAGADGPDVGDV